MKKQSSPERRTLISMLVSKEVLSRIASKWDEKEGNFASSYANLIGGWAVAHHAKYGKPPGKDIIPIFESWSESQSDKEVIEPVERFLSSLSGEYARLAQEVNPELAIDEAGELFNRVALQRAKDRIEGHLENNDVKKAQAVFDKHRPIEMGKGEWVDVLRDEEAMRRAFESKQEPLIKYPGDLGKFFKSAFERDSFVAFQASEKRGKTYWLLDVAWTAMKQGKKVAFFGCGDLTQNQMMLRCGIRAARRPLKATRDDQSGIMIPTRLEVTQDGVEIEQDERRYDTPLSWGEATRATQKIMQRSGTSDSLLRLSCHSNTSISVNGIRSYIDRWAKEDFFADLVVIDYADILAPITSAVADTRDEINASWKAMRKLSQDYHCCVLTATQADADSYSTETQSRRNFSNDKRKYAHVTAMIGINQTDKEKEKGIQRLNFLVLREEDYSERKCCYVAGCLAVAAPAIRSYYDGF